MATAGGAGQDGAVPSDSEIDSNGEDRVCEDGEYVNPWLRAHDPRRLSWPPT